MHAQGAAGCTAQTVIRRPYCPRVLTALYRTVLCCTGVPKALLGHQITKEARRPKFPPITPAAFVDLAERCWAPSPNDRWA